jgi:hypothetical protein
MAFHDLDESELLLFERSHTLDPREREWRFHPISLW